MNCKFPLEQRITKIFIYISSGFGILMSAIILITFDLIATFQIISILNYITISLFRVFELIIAFGMLGFTHSGVCSAWMDEGKCKTLFRLMVN